jgi:amino acid transporter
MSYFDGPLECANHPERLSIEKCEICGKALCGYCLYYTEDGQRLCEEHAQVAKANGLQIVPPAIYASGIIPSQAEAKRHDQNTLGTPKGAMMGQRALYHGNNQDVGAFIAMMIGVITLASCCGASYCLPFAAVILGGLVLMNADEAVDPKRTRIQAILGIATGGVFVCFIVACIAIYVMAIGASASSSTTYNPNFNFPTSTYTSVPSQTGPGSIQRTATAIQKTAEAQEP